MQVNANYPAMLLRTISLGFCELSGRDTLPGGVSGNLTP